jgi:DNA-binding protein H-NS
MQQEVNSRQPENLSINNEQTETTSKLEWIQPVLQKAPIAETAGVDPEKTSDGELSPGGS